MMVPKTDVNLAEILISSEAPDTLTVKVGEKSFDISYRNLSWLDKTDCVARATEYVQTEGGDIKTMFHIDIYFEEALRRMIIDSPWPMSRAVLRGVSDEVGRQIQSIIPAPMGDQDSLDEGSTPSSKRARRKTPTSIAPQSS